MNQHVMVNQDMDVVRWTEAEIRAYQKKFKAYQDATGDVNEFLEFLKEQYSINAKEGWQLGDGAFVRPKVQALTEEAPAKMTAPPQSIRAAKGKAKPAEAIPAPVIANGAQRPPDAPADIPREEM